jgi:hypothetical protein
MIVASSIVALQTESESLEDFLGVHMEQVDGRLHLSQPGLIKKLIATAELQDNKRSVRIPIRTNWNEVEKDKAARWGSFALSLVCSSICRALVLISPLPSILSLLAVLVPLSEISTPFTRLCSI